MIETIKIIVKLHYLTASNITQLSHKFYNKNVDKGSIENGAYHFKYDDIIKCFYKTMPDRGRDILFFCFLN